MRNLYINDLHLNLFQKYIMNKKKEDNSILKKHIKRNKSMNNSNSSFQTKTKIQNLSQNIIDDKNRFESPLKNFEIDRQILTPIKNLRHKFLEPKKNNEIHSDLELFSPYKNKFNLNKLVNSFLYRIYFDKSYKQNLFHGLLPFMEKKEKNINIKIDLRQTQKKGQFYIPIKKDNIKIKTKREIGIQNSLYTPNSFENNKTNIPNISNSQKKDESKDGDNNTNKNNYVKINYNYNFRNNKNIKNEEKQCFSSKIKLKKPKINNCKLIFNNYELINKKLSTNFLLYSKAIQNQKYSKIKRIISTERQKIGKILDELRYDQNNDSDKLKLDLVKLDGYILRKNKKTNNNSYNLFL